MTPMDSVPASRCSSLRFVLWVCAVLVEKLMRVDELGREGPFGHKEIIFTRFGTDHY